MDKSSRVLIVEARFYPELADALAAGATAALEAAGAVFERVVVPGALEIPAAIAFAACAKPPFDGFVALGCVIRGETSHYDLVCGESARGLQQLALGQHLAIGNGIQTVENQEQAWERVAVDRRNKGGGAAKACLALIDLKRRFGVV